MRWRVRIEDLPIKIMLLISASSSIIVLFLMTIFVLKEGLPAFWEVGLDELLMGTRWAPYYGRYGALPLIIGSVLIVMTTLMISVPLGISVSIYISEWAPGWLKDPLKSMIEMLAAIPSIVYGFVGLMFIAPAIAEFFGLSSGQVVLTSAIVLTMMVLPTIVDISTEVMFLVPKEWKEAAFALGAGKWQVIKDVVLPTSKSGIVAAVILAFGRAIGETIAVLLTCGCVGAMPEGNVFLQPVYAITAAIVVYMGEAEYGGTLYHVLYALAAILFMITFVMNLLADLILRKMLGGVRSEARI